MCEFVFVGVCGVRRTGSRGFVSLTLCVVCINLKLLVETISSRLRYDNENNKILRYYNKMIIHCTLYSRNYHLVRHSAKDKGHTIHYTLYTRQRTKVTLYTIHFTLGKGQRSHYTLYTLHSAKDKDHTIHYTLYTRQRTNITLYTLHSAKDKEHTIHYTLYTRQRAKNKGHTTMEGGRKLCTAFETSKVAEKEREK